MLLLHVWASYVMLVIAMIYSWVELLIAFSLLVSCIATLDTVRSLLRKEDYNQLITLPGSNDVFKPVLCIDIPIIHTHICLCSMCVLCDMITCTCKHVCIWRHNADISCLLLLPYSWRKSLSWNRDLTDYLDWQASESQGLHPVPELQILVTMLGFYEA